MGYCFIEQRTDIVVVVEAQGLSTAIHTVEEQAYRI